MYDRRDADAILADWRAATRDLAAVEATIPETASQETNSLLAESVRLRAEIKRLRAESDRMIQGSRGQYATKRADPGQ